MASEEYNEDEGEEHHNSHHDVNNNDKSYETRVDLSEGDRVLLMDQVKVARPMSSPSSSSSLFVRVTTALFYALASFLIMIINKHVLTIHSFPSFQVLGLGQMVATVVILFVCKRFRIVSFPDLSRDTVTKIFPLPLFYLGNMIFGLGSTKELSLPMMTVLRRFSIVMTMAGEFMLINNKPSLQVQLSVYAMVFGALVAAANDLSFNLKGYIFVLLTDFCTAAYGVVMKKKLNSKDLGKSNIEIAVVCKYGLMYYNSLFMLMPCTAIALLTGDFDSALQFDEWANMGFVLLFVLSCIFGFVLMLATMLCTQFNSALTTTIVGCLKNILITYLGMIIGGDYIFSWANFVGLTISVVASLFYTMITFRRQSTNSSQRSIT